MITTLIRTILTILAIMSLICVHELGHLLVGMGMGAKPYAFSVGFGPKLLHKRCKNGLNLYLRAIPLGGYCSFDKPDDVKNAAELAKEINAVKGKKTVSIRDLMDLELDKLPCIKRFCVYVAGPCFNVLMALVLSFVAYVHLGTVVYQPEVRDLVEGGAAIGILEAGDRILEVNGAVVENGDAMRDFVKVSNGDELNIKIERNGEEMNVTIQPEWNDEAKAWKMGIYQETEVTHLDLASYAKSAVDDVQWELGGIFDGLIGLVSGRVKTDEVSGIIGAVDQMQEYVKPDTVAVFLMLMSLFSANLAVINLLPIPGLDGSKALTAVIEGVFKIRIPQRLELILTGGCMIALMALMVLLGIKDVMNIL